MSETLPVDDIARAADGLKNKDFMDDLNPELRRYLEKYSMDFEQRRAFFYQDFVVGLERELERINELLRFLIGNPLSDRVEGFVERYKRLLTQHKMDMIKEVTIVRQFGEIFKEAMEKQEEELRRGQGSTEEQ